MTTWKYAKSKGITLKEVSEISKVGLTTLNNWFKNKPELFDAVIEGCKQIKENQS